MASSSENTETKPLSRQPLSAKEHIQVRKSKETKSEQMADTSISGDVENASSRPHGHRESERDRERYPHHRSAGGQRKQQYHYGARDQRTYYQNRMGRQRSDRYDEEHRHQKAQGHLQEKVSNKDEAVKDSGTSHGADGNEVASSIADENGGDQVGYRDTKQGEGGRAKRGRNRHRQRRQGGKESDGPPSTTGVPHKRETEHIISKGLVEGSDTGKDSNRLYNNDDSHGSRGSGALSAGSRRPGRSDRDQHWRSEQRQRPPREEGRRYYRNNRDRRRGEEKRDLPTSASKRGQDGDAGSRNDSDISDKQEGATACSNSSGDLNTKSDPQVETHSKSTSGLPKPEQERTAERGDRRSQSSKPRSYDYTKPHHSGSDFPSSSRYKGRSHHHLKMGEKEFTPTVQSDELSQQLTAETYECMVCCDRVRERDQIWSCQNCYHIFHLKCIKKWATAPTFASTEEDSNCEGWRCPSCRNLSKYVPSIYRCYCGKCINPRRRSKGELTVPHSCGELCKKKLAVTPESNCRHECQLPCHPGPCPPCPVMVTRYCPCGTTKHQVRCSKTGDLPSCGAVCGKTLACGRHKCNEKCHASPCSSCAVSMELTCHCGQAKKKVLCGEAEELEFSCEQICNRELDCGNHLCERPCHAGSCFSCCLLPANITHCPCGAETVDSLLQGEGSPRTSCLDPVPTCNNICGKTLPCSTADVVHTCESVCHLGECPPCTKSTLVTCRCARNSVEKPCADRGKDGEFLCSHVCNKKKSCSRHRCNVRCCKDSEHVCELLCGKKLQCGLHTCQETCHSGHCQPCWEYSYEELTCHCGAEMIYPPIPCGTYPPPCSHPCARLHSCHHPVTHNCHSDQECPKCTFLTEKMCMGGHEMRRNIPCHLSDVSCGNPCGKTLPCGMHKCKRTCHKDDCLSNSLEGCQQPCTNQRKYCAHECGNPCHMDQPCPDTPCKTTIIVKCKCGRRSEKMLCLACGSGAMHQTFQKMFSKDLGARIRELQSGHSVSISAVTVSSEGRARYLECDEVCAQEERNRRLAAALEIDNPNISPMENEVQYSAFLLEQAREDTAFVISIEENLRTLAEAALKSSTTQARTHHFRPMKNTHRRIIHELSVHYGCDTTSYDQEPSRNVMASVNKSKAKIPVISLTKLIEREKHRLPPAPVSVSAVRGQVSEEGNVKTLVHQGNQMQTVGTENSSAPDYFYDDVAW